MGIDIKFENNCMRVSAEMEREILKFLEEEGEELESQTMRNSRVDSGRTKGSYGHVVVKRNGGAEVQVGSNLENAIWEEYGTGEYAIEGNGRKGGWYIPAEKLSPKAKSRMKKTIGKNGKVYYFTKGKKAQRPLFKAFTARRGAIERRASQIMKGLGG